MTKQDQAGKAENFNRDKKGQNQRFVLLTLRYEHLSITQKREKRKKNGIKGLVQRSRDQ